MANLFDKNGKKSERVEGKDVFRWRGLPKRGAYTLKVWESFGYKPKSKDDFSCWVQSSDNRNYYKIYFFDKVTPIRSAAAVERRGLFHRFPGLTARQIYTRLMSILRKKQSAQTTEDEAFLFLCQREKSKLLTDARYSYGFCRIPKTPMTMFTGWKNHKRRTQWRNKYTDIIAKQNGGFWQPGTSRMIKDFDARIEGQWQ